MEPADLAWAAAQLGLGVPALFLLLRRRGKGNDPVPRGVMTPDRRGVVLAFALFAGATLLGLLGLTVLGDGERPPFELLISVDALSKLAALALLFFLVRKSGPGSAPPPAPLRRAVPAGVLTGLAFLPVATATVLLQQWLGPLFGREMEAQGIVTEALGGGTGTFLVVAAFAVLIAPLFEEMLFRGFLYEGVRAWAGPLGSGLLTAALFALFHGEVDAMPVTFLLGVCLADLRERTGGRSAPIAMHACYNAWQVGGMLLLRLSGNTGG